jgi:hypothetical protein
MPVVIPIAVGIAEGIGAGIAAGASAIGGAVGAVGGAIAGATLGEIALGVGLAGAGLTVIGQVTGVKELSYAGMALGALGVLGGVGANIGGIANMTAQEAFTSATNFLTGQAGTASAESALSAGGQLTKVTSGGLTYGTDMSAPSTSLAPNAPGITQPVGQAAQITNPTSVAGAAQSAEAAQIGQSAVKAPGVLGATATPSPEAGLQAATKASTTVPSAATMDNATTLASMNTKDAWLNPATRTLLEQAKTAKPGWFSSLSPNDKTMLALVAGQAGSGLLGGMFQGMNASEQLDFQRLVNQQNYGQMQYLNRNNQYAPKLSFQGGALNAAK